MRKILMTVAAAALMALPMAAEAGQCKPGHIVGTWRTAVTSANVVNDRWGRPYIGEPFTMDLTIKRNPWGQGPDVTRALARGPLPFFTQRWTEVWFFESDGNVEINRFCTVTLEYEIGGGLCQFEGFMNRTHDFVTGNGYCDPNDAEDTGGVAATFTMMRR